MTWGHVGVAAGIAVVGGAMWWMALGYNPEARRIPLLVAAPLTLLALGEVVVAWRQARATPRRPSPRTPPSERPSAAELLSIPSDAHSVWRPLALLAAFVCLFSLFGQVLGTWLFALGFLGLTRELRPGGAAVFATVLAAALWGTGTLLEVDTFDGLLLTALG